ncbi:MAG: UbiA family prenyltransferase [Candidatus Bathyarchaeota archaeon]|nr:UbiA family prenyltransferase [Candidatus Bathyarchaeota archaeon]
MKRTEYIKKFEKYNIGPPTYLLILFSIIFIRVVLENIVSLPGLSPSIAFTHQSFCFFLSSFLSSILLISLLSKEKVQIISKVILIAYTIIILAPIIDYLVSRVAFYEYIIDKTVPLSTPNWGYLLKAFMSFGVGIIGVTLGQQVEMTLFLLLSTSYIWIKTKSRLRTVLTPLLVYTLTFLYGSFPNYVSFGGLYEAFNSQHNLLYLSSVYSILIVIQISIWLILYDKSKFIWLLRNLVSGRGIHYAAMAGFGGFLAGARLYSVLLALICVALFWQAARAINDVYDMPGDKLSNTNSAVTHGLFNASDLAGVSILCSLLSLLFASVLGYTAVVISLLAIPVSIIYSVPPIRIKRLPLVSTFVIAASAVLAFALGFYSEPLQMAFPKTLVIAMLVCFTLAFNTKDLKDFEEDKANMIWTIPVIFGLEKGRVIIAAFDLLSYLAAPLILGINGLLLPAAFFGIVTFFVVLRKESREWQIFLLYFLFLTVMFFIK